MSEIILTENVEDWELGEGFTKSEKIKEILIPKSEDLLKYHSAPVIVYVEGLSCTTCFAFALDGSAGYANCVKLGAGFTIVPRKKEVPYDLNDIFDISDNWFKKKGTQSMGKFMRLDVDTIVIYGYPATDLVGLCQNYLHSPNGKDWYTLTKKV